MCTYFIYNYNITKLFNKRNPKKDQKISLLKNIMSLKKKFNKNLSIFWNTLKKIFDENKSIYLKMSFSFNIFNSINTIK
jgi:hypothetical protein